MAHSVDHHWIDAARMNPRLKMNTPSPRVPSRTLLLLCLITLSLTPLAHAQIEVETVVTNGPSENRIDILFFGDGYQAAEDDEFETDVDVMLDYMFDPAAAGFPGGRYADPLPRYRNFFNVISVLQPSIDSGVTTPTNVIMTSLGANFGTPQNTAPDKRRGLAIDPILGNALLDTLLTEGLITDDQIDLKMVVVNTPERGGTGGYFGWSVYNSDHADSLEISLHEVGHTFAGLADEGWSSNQVFTGVEEDLTMWNFPALPIPNCTSEIGGKWDHWLGYNDPDPRLGIGWYLGCFHHTEGLYRPSDGSKMRFAHASGQRPFDAVGREAIIRQIYRVVDPLDSHNPPAGPVTDPGTLSVIPIDTNVIHTRWEVNGVPDGTVGTTYNTGELLPGTYTITAFSYDSWYIYDPADSNHDLDGWRDPVRGSLAQTVNWTVTITDNGSAFCDLPVPTFQLQSVKPLNPVSGGRFGHPIVVDGDHMVVGHGHRGVSVFERDSDEWREVTYLEPSHMGAEGERYLLDFDVSGDTIVIGIGPRHFHPTQVYDGRVYVFKRDVSGSWQEHQFLQWDMPTEVLYGISVALSGDILLVGAMLGPDWSSTSYVDVFVRGGQNGFFTKETQFNFPDAWGVSLDLDGSTAVVGAPPYCGPRPTFGELPPDGAAYIFKRVQGNWVQEAYFQEGTTHECADFGRSVAIHGDRVVIGAPGEILQVSEAVGPAGFRVGNFYIFDRIGTTWTLNNELGPLFNRAQAGPLRLLDISSQGILVGAPSDEGTIAAACGHLTSGQESSGGAFYVEENLSGNFEVVQYFKSIGPVNYEDGFGESGALDEPHAYLGIPGDDEVLWKSGVVLAYELNAGPISPIDQDLNRDGYPDLVFQSGSDWGVRLMRNTAHQGTLTGSPLPTGANIVAFGDVIGGHAPDIVYVSDDGGLIIQELDTNANFASNPVTLGSINLGWTLRGCGDFNADGHEDFVFQHDDGRLAAWFLENGTFSHSSFFTSDVKGDPLWRLAAIDDFNMDGFDDFMFQHRNGRVAVWNMQNLSLLGGQFLDFDVRGSVHWKIVASGDANADGFPDIYWQHWDGRAFVWHLQNERVLARLPVDGPDGRLNSVRNSGSQPRTPRNDIDDDGRSDLLFQDNQGRLALWSMDGQTRLGAEFLANDRQQDPTWRVAGFSDINGDKYEDIIWQRDDGDTDIWLMKGASKIGQTTPSHHFQFSPTWRMVACNDLNKNGLDDWIFQNQDHGGLFIWYMNGAQRITSGWPDANWTSTRTANWRLATVTDMNSDGNPDFIWQNINTGSITFWYMDGASFISDVNIPYSLDPQWRLESVHDLDHDSFPDFVFRSTSSGRLYAWFMQGTNRVGHGSMGNVSGSWDIRHSGD